MTDKPASAVARTTISSVRARSRSPSTATWPARARRTKRPARSSSSSTAHPIPALSSFDLAVPGAGEYSTMNVFARLGFDVWTMDHENYGRSSRTEGNSDIASGVEDLIAATALVIRETGPAADALHGRVLGRVARRGLCDGPARTRRSPGAERLHLYRQEFADLGEACRAARLFPHPQPSTARPRDDPQHLHPRPSGDQRSGVAEALADAELVFGDQVPTGTYLDMTANLPVVDPAKVEAPVMIVRGEHDGIASEEDLLDFFRQLPNPGPAIRRPARRGACARLWPQPASAVARRARLSVDAAAPRSLIAPIRRVRWLYLADFARELALDLGRTGEEQLHQLRQAIAEAGWADQRQRRHPPAIELRIQDKKRQAAEVVAVQVRNKYCADAIGIDTEFAHGDQGRGAAVDQEGAVAALDKKSRY